jgi:lytic murein transglycosylase
MRIGTKAIFAFTLAFPLLAATMAQAASCSSKPDNFANWVEEFKAEAAQRGISGNVLDAAFSGVTYAKATIRADRGQKSFKLSLAEFMKKRGSAAIVSRGRSMKAKNPGLFAQIERRYGVPAGPVIAIWGMETGFGNFLGKEHTLSAVATLAYDCRRTEYFTNQLYAALQLVQAGTLHPDARGAAHGEIGQTQFLPANVLTYGVDGDGNGRIDLVRSTPDALASTANFLAGHGWRAGAGYQPGEPNFAAIQGWNAASVYQQAIAIMGRDIDK